MLFRIVALGLIPLIVSVFYVRVWPGVAFRPTLIGSVGALIGLAASLVALVWRLWPALTRLGISRGNRPGPTLAQITSATSALGASVRGRWLSFENVVAH